jgi:hypothetical protein
VNIIAVLIASIVSLRNLIYGHSVVEDFLHLISLTTTITLHFYSVDNPRDPFLISLHVIRSLRLLFPLNVHYTFKDFMIKYAKIIKKIAKVSVPLITIILTISLIFGQAATNDLNSRCRSNVPFGSGSFPPPIDMKLCGSRNCAQN